MENNCNNRVKNLIFNFQFLRITKRVSYDCQLGRSVNSKEQLFNGFLLLPRRFNRFLVRFFRLLGRVIGRKTSHFIVTPLLLSCLCLTGFQKIIIEDNFENLAIPRKGGWVEEKRNIDEHFPTDSLNFDPLRQTYVSRYVNLVIASKDSKNLLHDDLWKEIKRLDRIIMAVQVYHEEEAFSFQDICAKWKGRCFSPLLPIKPNDLSQLFGFLRQHIPKGFSSFDFEKGVNFSLAISLGGQQFSSAGVLTSADAISLYYWLRSDHYVHNERAKKWEKEIMNIVYDFSSPAIAAYSYASRTPSDELEQASERVRPLLIFSVLTIVIFTALSAAMTDWVRSKILLSLLGIASALLATGSAFGLAMYCGVPFIAMNHATVFLMLGIGIDDMFVLLAAWRMTSIRDTVSERMASTYEHACISITITSLTNMLAFLIGTFTSIKSVEIFCLYSCISVLVMYVMLLTFFGGCLAAFGYLEKSQRHSIFCMKVLSKSQADSKSKWYRIFMAGGINPMNPKHKKDNQPHAGMRYLRNVLGTFLTKPIVKCGVIIGFVVYITASIYGISVLKSGGNFDRVEFIETTESYFSIYEKYFKNKPSPVQVLLKGSFNYSASESKRQLLDLHEQLEDQPFVQSNATISWVRDWYQHIEDDENIPFTIENETQFINYLRKVKDTELSSYTSCDDIIEHFGKFQLHIENIPDLYRIELVDFFNFIEDWPCNSRDIFKTILTHSTFTSRKDELQMVTTFSWIIHTLQQFDDFYEMDIDFNEGSSRISASRFLIFVDDAKNDTIQKKVREIAARYPDLDAVVYSYDRLAFDEIILVKLTTISTTVSTTLLVLLVSFVFIPNPLCSLWVGLSIVSIELGVVGFMALWGVPLDAISMVNLVMCIGFSVDFSAHISYAFLSVNSSCSKERIKGSIYAVGLPIMLGGLSTILGLFPLWFSQSGVFVKFFKIVFLVIIFGMLHAMMFLPVFMSFMKFSYSTLKQPYINYKNNVVPSSSSNKIDCERGVSYFDDKMQSSDPLCSVATKQLSVDNYNYESMISEDFMTLNASELVKLFYSQPLSESKKKF